jgi:hypothetical protein
VSVGTDAHRPSIDTEGATFEHAIAIDASLIYCGLPDSGGVRPAPARMRYGVCGGA